MGGGGGGAHARQKNAKSIQCVYGEEELISKVGLWAVVTCESIIVVRANQCLFPLRNINPSDMVGTILDTGVFSSCSFEPECRVGCARHFRKDHLIIMPLTPGIIHCPQMIHTISALPWGYYFGLDLLGLQLLCRPCLTFFASFCWLQPCRVGDLGWQGPYLIL